MTKEKAIKIIGWRAKDEQHDSNAISTTKIY